MKNICFLIGDINHSGGTERVTTLIANTLDENYHKVFLLSLNNGDNPFFQLNKNIKIKSLFEEKVSMKKHFLQCVKRIRKFLIENQIDTLIVVDSISCVFTVPACIGIQVNHICWEHFNLKVNLGSSFRTLGRCMAARWCDKIVTLTERDKCFWDSKFNLESTGRVVAIANPTPYSLQDNIPELSYKKILCVGRLTYQKGFDLLVPAWAEIAQKLPDWKIIIVGTGEDESALKKMTLEYGVSDSIEFLGQQKNMDLFYRSASFFCMSSRFEGLPMVLLEAQSYGLPIVAFDCDTGPAEIVDSGINGYLVKKEDIKDFSDRILKMCTEGEFESFSFAASKKSLNYDAKKIAIKWSNII